MSSSFLMALGRHDGGSLVENADDMLREVVRDVTRYGKSGKVTVTLTVEPNGESALKVKADVKATLPKRPQGEAFYWPTEDHDLTRTPPKDELDFGPRPVPGGMAKA